MEALSCIQTIIDKNSNVIPEGDYLELCGATRSIFLDKSHVNNSIFGKEDSFPIQLQSLNGRMRNYFEHVFSEENKDIEYNVLMATLTALRKELKDLKPFKRITQKIRKNTIHSFVEIHNLQLEENTYKSLEQLYKDGKILTNQNNKPFSAIFKSLCQTYVDLANIQMDNTAVKIKKRIASIEDYLELIQP